MAMRRACGFEAGSIDVFDAVGGTFATSQPAISNVQARSGDYSCLYGLYEWGQFATRVGNTYEWYVQVAVYIYGWTMYPNYAGRILGFLDRNGVCHARLVVNTTTQMVEAWYGPETTLRGTSIIPVQTNEWAVLEVHLIADDAGVFEVRLNGVNILTVNGDFYNNAGIQEVAVIRVGGQGGTAGPPEMYVDDFVANDTTGLYNNSWPNQLGLWPVIPEGVGTTTQLTPTAGDNWDTVEEVPPDDGNYVYSDTLDQFDTYEATDIAVAGLVRGVIKWGRAREDVAAPRDFAHMWRINGTDYTGGDLAIDTSFDCYDEIDEVSPDTGVPFTTGEINAAEIGVKVR